MRDSTIESLPPSEKEAAEYHVEWATDELGDGEAAKDFVTQVLIKMGPQRLRAQETNKLRKNAQ